MTSSTATSTYTSSTSYTSVTESRVSSFKKVEQNQKTEAEKSFKFECPEGFAISKMTTSVVKTKWGTFDTCYQFSYSKITKESQKACKKRVTKFVESAMFSSISCKDEESMCGVLSDYDAKFGRIYALQCCDNSNAKAEKEVKKIETCSLKEGFSKSFQSSSSSQVVKSVKIVSITSTTITYEVTYCSYSYTKESRFSSSSTVDEYKSSSSSTSSSGKGSKSKGGKSKGGKSKGGKSKGGKSNKSGKKGGKSH
jgi:uncharacterized membrane protein YgcG